MKAPRIRVACVVLGALLCASTPVLVGCGETHPMPEVDLLVRVEAATTSVRPGQGVPVTVTRVWRRDHEPSPWDDAALEPLILRDERVSRREGRERVLETRRYRAYVFRLDDVQVPEIVFASRPKAGGPIAIARSTPLALTVRPELDPERPGPPEGPGEAPPRPAPAGMWVGVLLLLVAAFEGLVWRARRRVLRAERARRAAPAATLRALRAKASTDPEACRADLAVAVDAVRDHLAMATGVPARARTTEELASVLDADMAARWCAFAAPADRARFAGDAVDADALVAALDRGLAIAEGDPGGPA